MLDLKDTPNGKLISSRQLYKELSTSTNHYSEWVGINITTIGVEGLDYFPGYKIVLQHMERPDILLSLEFARSLCYINRTKKALKIRKWLFECELTTSN